MIRTGGLPLPEVFNRVRLRVTWDLDEDAAVRPGTLDEPRIVDRDDVVHLREHEGKGQFAERGGSRAIGNRLRVLHALQRARAQRPGSIVARFRLDRRRQREVRRRGRHRGPAPRPHRRLDPEALKPKA